MTDNLLKKKIILVNPYLNPLFHRLIAKFSFRKTTPFSFHILTAITPKDYNIRVINQRFFWRKGDFTNDALVGITCFTMNAYEAYRLADRFRAQGAKVVMGGPHVTCLPEEALEHADSIVVGEAESVWKEILKDYESEALKRIYNGEPLDDYFSPVFDYFLKLSPRVLLDAGMLVSRGCKYRCDFCARPQQKLRFIKIEQVIALLKRIKEAKKPFSLKPTVVFKDDGIFSSPAYAKELFRQMIPLGIKWAGQSTLDIAFDDEALRLAKESGCVCLGIGFETLYPQDYEKTSLSQVSNYHDYKKAIRNIKSHGMRVFGHFILGFDHYIHRDYLRLLWFLMTSGLWFASLTLLTPTPGSRLFDKFKEENRLLTLDWRAYDYFFNVVFKPKHTSRIALKAWFFTIRLISLAFSPYILLLVLVPLLLYFFTFQLSAYLFSR
jgi:radical SAM superfamily enzyme YgiQ (UPF0313 family)